ncbi:MAG: bifunctional phosphopantothenoylcysteine decarboxylase/phosphopantothenate--cysteine ligase CoaBC [Cyclobacteriaceae bacterium]|nr:bifunctional phosphopantothenoylcysteine decarboxylase/phosphopantothenate--cysteine ligase CoaBC [Cyclobacteriaceae bacterium]
MLRGKKILLGITSSIAAYKSALLVRLLIKAGAEVRVVLSPAAQQFVSPLTLSTLSKNPVLSSFQKNDTGEWNNHVDLALWADLIVIAPATANTLAKMAHGLCDNLLLAVYLSARCPVFVSPAMDLDMHAHQSTENNLTKLRSYGNHIIEAQHGELASGLTGTGRMAEPEVIFNIVKDFLLGRQLLKGKKALVTAGPTRESLDPVRYITNRSSGKMGYSIARELADQGCEVHLISGPTNLTPPENVKVININTAEEMFEATVGLFDAMNIAVLAAAVSDYTPAFYSTQKIKKKTSELSIDLKKTKDIAAELGGLKKDQLIVGFALETENEEDNARLKLKNKNFDLIVLNSLNEEGAGFEHDTNKIIIFDKNNKRKDFELKDKSQVAKDIVHEIIEGL